MCWNNTASSIDYRLPKVGNISATYSSSGRRTILCSDKEGQGGSRVDSHQRDPSKREEAEDGQAVL